MKNKELYDKIVRIAEENGWKASIEFEDSIEFQKYSPAGRDFSFSVDYDGDYDNFVDRVNEYYEGFDPDTETYIWLNEEGHGANGAPYRMRDVLDDSEAIDKMLRTLSEAFERELL